MKRIIFTAILSLALSATTTAQSAPRIGAAAPEITGKDIFGKPLKLSQFKGKVVLLDFWGDW